MEVQERFIDSVVRGMDSELEVDQLRKLKIVLTLNLNKYQIEESKNKVIIYDETSDIAAYKQYFVSKKLQGLSLGTLNLYKATIDRFMRTVRRPFSDISTNEIRMFIANRDMIDHISSATLSRERGCICRFFTWLYKEEYLSKDPGLRVEEIKVEKRIKKAFTPIEIELMRNAATSLKEKVVIELLLSTGCRVSELVSFTLENYDRDRGTIPVIGKGNKERIAFVNAKAKVAIDNYLNKSGHSAGPIIQGRKQETPMNVSSIQKMISVIAERANVRHAHPHKFRRTAATLALKHGMDINDVRIFLGHSSMNTTLQYLDLTGVNFKEIHDKYLG